MSTNTYPNTVLISFAHPGPSYGVNLVSAVLRQNDYPESTIYCPPSKKNFEFSERQYDALVEKCLELEPDIVGISVISTTYVDAIRVTSDLKKKKKDLLIVWGGIHPTLEPDNCLEYADIVCRGEGEEAMLKLVRAVQSKTSYDTIQNLWVKNESKIYKNPAILIANLDSLPYADQECRDKYILEKNKIVELERRPDSYFLMTARGCHFSCFFCSNQAIKEVYDRYRVRRRSVDNVLQELSSAIKDNPHLNSIFICDDVFTYDLDWVKAFSEKYRTEIGLPFQCFTHPEFTKEEMIKTVREMGCDQISLGINGCSTRMRAMFNRKSSDEKIIEACQVLVKYRFKLFNIDMILSPFDTEEDRREGLDFLLKLPKPYYTNIQKLTFLPKAEITTKALEMGLISKEEITFVPMNPFKDYTKIFLSRDGKWWSLYFICGKKRIPNGLIRIAAKIPVIAIGLFGVCKLYEKLLQLAGRTR